MAKIDLERNILATISDHYSISKRLPSSHCLEITQILRHVRCPRLPSQQGIQAQNSFQKRHIALNPRKSSRFVLHLDRY